MVSVAQLVVRLIVVQVVAGSSPVLHPIGEFPRYTPPKCRKTRRAGYIALVHRSIRRLRPLGVLCGIEVEHPKRLMVK